MKGLPLNLNYIMFRLNSNGKDAVHMPLPHDCDR